MKYAPLVILSAGCVLLNSCENLRQNMNQPIQSSENDPLKSPTVKKPVSNRYAATPPAPTFSPGQYVQASLPNTTFYRKKPWRRSAGADKVLASGSVLKVIANSAPYVKVETLQGEVGFVPAIMVEERKKASSQQSKPRSSRKKSSSSSSSRNSSYVKKPVQVSSPSSTSNVEQSAPDPEIPSIKAPSSVADEILPPAPNPSSGGDLGDSSLIDPNMDLELKISEIIESL